MHIIKKYCFTVNTDVFFWLGLKEKSTFNKTLIDGTCGGKKKLFMNRRFSSNKDLNAKEKAIELTVSGRDTFSFRMFVIMVRNVV